VEGAGLVHLSDHSNIHGSGSGVGDVLYTMHIGGERNDGIDKIRSDEGRARVLVVQKKEGGGRGKGQIQKEGWYK